MSGRTARTSSHRRSLGDKLQLLALIAPAMVLAVEALVDWLLAELSPPQS